jgi:tetratricopeptide (TPR) repeat protein
MPEQRVTDPEVYALYLQGRHFTNFKSEENLEKAVAFLKRALAIDPDYAPAWVAITVAYQEQVKYGWRTAEQAFTLSMAAVDRALTIDSNMAEAWASLAYLKRFELDWEGAKIAIDKALMLEPNNAFIIGSAATLASTFGKLDESVELFERDVELDPLGLGGLRALGIRYADVGRFDESLETFSRILAINPDFPSIHINIGVTYLWKGDTETAMIEICTSSKHMAPLELFSKRHFSACTFSSLAC